MVGIANVKNVVGWPESQNVGSGDCRQLDGKTMEVASKEVKEL